MLHFLIFSCVQECACLFYTQVVDDNISFKSRTLEARLDQSISVSVKGKLKDTERHKAQGDNWSVRSKGMERGLHRSSLLWQTHCFWSGWVCGDGCLCVQPGPYVTHREMTDSQRLPAAALCLREHLIQQHMNADTHRHTEPWEFFTGTENTGRYGWNDSVKVSTQVFINKTVNSKFFFFLTPRRQWWKPFPAFTVFPHFTLTCQQQLNEDSSFWIRY